MTLPLRAQICEDVPVTISLEGNAVSMVLSAGGDTYFDGRDAAYIVTPPVIDGETTEPFAALFAGGLWLGTKDPGGAIKIAAQQYGRAAGDFDYQPGPLTANGTPFSDECADWNRGWKITRAAVEAHRALFINAPIDPAAIDTAILGWPGNGNPYFSQENGFPLPNTTQGLAPYWDVDLDGIYDPTQGDYPLFPGDQAVWTVFNDARINDDSKTAANLLIDIQLLAYSFNSADPILNTTTFQEYKFINRSDEDYIDFHAGQWVDFDLGCFTNDRFNSIPEEHLYYVYNHNDEEEDVCELGVAPTGNTSPVTIVQMLEGLRAFNPDSTAEVDLGMSSLTAMLNGAVGSPPPEIIDPTNAQEYYNYLTGRWRDGSPITRGGIGFNTAGEITRFMYDGGSTPDGPWTNCNTGLMLADQRTLMSSGPVTMTPGAVNGMTIAVTTIFDVDYSDGCPDENAVVSAATSVRDVFEPTISTQVAPGRNLAVSTYPNPATTHVTFEVAEGLAIERIDLFYPSGRIVRSLPGAGPKITYATASDNLLPGVYFYRALMQTGEQAVGRIIFRR